MSIIHENIDDPCRIIFPTSQHHTSFREISAPQKPFPSFCCVKKTDDQSFRRYDLLSDCFPKAAYYFFVVYDWVQDTQREKGNVNLI